MTTLSWVFSASGWGVAVFAVALVFTGRIKRYQYYGLASIALFLWALSDVCGHLRMWSFVDAGLCGWFAYVWWSGGGGDDTKKRLRKWARKFAPTRRTAPQGA